MCTYDVTLWWLNETLRTTRQGRATQWRATTRYNHGTETHPDFLTAHVDRLYVTLVVLEDLHFAIHYIGNILPAHFLVE